MKIKAILNSTSHRSWELPKGNWKYFQEWNDALFLHFKVDELALRKLVPTELEIDKFDGECWVSVVAFNMEKIRPRYLPSFPPISNFHEINIRTYIKRGDKTGVYFLSIEGGKKLSCLIAKSLSKLPYRFSPMRRAVGSFSASNTRFKDKFDASYKLTKQVHFKTSLDNWLTERYALYQDTNKGINEFEIHHLPWSLTFVDVNSLQIEYPRFANLITGSPDLCHYSKGVQVLAWDKVLV